ncbi:endoribonuclease L-PSP [Novosphingobium sp. Rr 2-17]|uniref:Rid family hydrolase n=1 Tax=Novosphingobium sp. Rr 2-17 TaxID=555793 RepID=UPI0002698EE5|nr:Rid family hydrolase [Novosphingobium sp. Rr 2-17]EIZ79299.1 endoribonuclease L-PSP [Novosphingobium sp. Rr 2-17]
MLLKTLLPRCLIVTAGALAIAAAPANAQVTKLRSNPKSLILDGAKISAGSDMLFLSGQLAAPLDPSKPPSAAATIEDYGDTKTQTISTLTKIKALLEAQGYKMSDLFKLTLFIAPDPKLGKLDFAGANAGFKQFFDTPDNPSTVARSAFQVAALAAPQFLIEIEAIAAKPHAPLAGTP